MRGRTPRPSRRGFPDSRRARRRARRLPGLPPAGRLARAGGAGEARGVPRRGVLGTPGARLRPGGRAAADRRAGPGRARRQPDRPDVHRRPLRRRAVRRAARRRAGQPAHRRAPRRRAGAVRHPDHRAGALRPAGQQADPGRAGHAARALAARRAGPARADRARGRGARRRSAGRRCCRCWPRPGWAVPRPRPRFGHGAQVELAGRARAAAPVRLLPRQPAEHLHRPAHPGDAGGGARAAAERPGCRARLDWAYGRIAASRVGPRAG